MTNVDTLKILAFLLLKLHPPQIPKNIRNLGTWFLRKVPESEEGLTRKSQLSVSTRNMDKAILINEAASIFNQRGCHK